MGIAFPGGAVYISNTTPPPLPAMPITLMCWINFPALPGANMGVWGLTNNAVTTAAGSWLRIRCDTTTGAPSADSAIAGTSVRATAATGPTANIWFFVVARFISTTNRRIAVLYHTGPVHAVNTTSNVPASLNELDFGGTKTSNGSPALPMIGQLAECTLVGADVQPGGLQLGDNLLRQLAYGGPFSVPSIADTILVYRSFRSALGSNQDLADEHDVGGKNVRQIFTQVGASTRCQHPPLPYGYERPVDNVRPAMLI